MKTHAYSAKAKEIATIKHGGKEIIVTMSAADYKIYMSDHREEGHIFHGFKSDDALLNHINDTWGLLGTVTEIDIVD